MAGGLAAAVPSMAFAQQRKVIGYLANNPNPWNVSTFKAFIQGLRDRGWIVGKNLEIRIRSSDNDDDRFVPLAEQLARENVDVIVTTGQASTAAAKRATTTIPIVFGSTANPVEYKLVDSFARPGGNVTGMAFFSMELGPKRLEMLKTIFPRAKRIARLYSASNRYMAPTVAQAPEAAARKLNLVIQHMPVRTEAELWSAMHVARSSGVDAVTLEHDAVFARPARQQELANLAIQYRLPLMGPNERYARLGALISHGENFEAMYRRAAVFVDAVLRGRRPADIPVEQPTLIETFVNMKTANELGITFPPSILLAAGDNVIA